MTLAIISKQTKGLFWKSFTKGKANIGRKSVSPNIGDQCANADKHLKSENINI